MTIEQLRNFIVVARFCNIAKAADYLYISHSSLSRSISALESDLGVQLLIRDNRSVRLTPAGEYIKANGPELLQAFDVFCQQVRNSGNDVLGNLTVAMPNFENDDLFDCLHAFRRQYPDIRLKMSCVGVDDVSQQVLQGSADIGITYSYQVPSHNPYLESTKLYDEPFCLVVGADHYLASQDSISAFDLPNEELGMMEAGLKNWMSSGSGNLENSATTPAENTQSVTSLMLQVKAGLQIAILPYSLAREHGAGCHIVEVTDATGNLSVVMLRLKKSANIAADLLRKMLAERFLAS